MMRVAVAVILLALLGGCGGSSPQSESAAAFVKRVTVEFSRGQAGPLWDQLVPAEQRLVSRATYVSCARNGFRLKGFKVLEQYDENVQVLTQDVPSTAVSVQVMSDDGVTTATLHAVKVNGTWRWILARSDLAAFRAGRCP